MSIKSTSTTDMTNRANGMVKVIHGANDDEFDIAGATVFRVQSNLKDAFNIPATAPVFVKGKRVETDYVLQAGDTLEFCVESGRKGTRSMFTKADILLKYPGFPPDVLLKVFDNVRHHDMNAKGEALWMESVVDDWLDDFYSRGADDGRDKAIPPSRIRIDGQIYDDIRTGEWRLMDIVLKRRNEGVEGVPINEVIEHVWGHDCGDKNNALKCNMTRINKTLSEQGSLASVSIINGFVALNEKQHSPESD